MIGLLLACLLPACSQEAPPQGLRFGLASEPLTLDPRHATDAAGERIARLLFAALTDHDAQGRAVPALADWVRETPTRYRFTLRPERAPFSDGTRLTAVDVAATYQAILDPAVGSPHRQSLKSVRAVRADGEESVVFELSQPDPLLPGLLNLGILPAKQASTRGRLTAPTGSGPFRIAGQSAGMIRLIRRRDGMPLTFLKVPDPTVRALKLVRGELDMIQNDLPPEIRGWLASQPGLQVLRRAGDTFAYLGFNLADEQTGQQLVRRAIAYALDREALIRYLFQGGATTAEAILGPDHWAGNPELKPHAHDPARARSLLGQAGYGPDHPLRLSYKTSADPFRLRLAAAIQAQLAEVGIQVTIQSYDWGTFYGDIKAGRFQLYSLAWVGVKSPDILRHVFHSTSLPPQGANRGRYRSPYVDAALDAAAAASDRTHMAEAYRQVQSFVHDDLVYVPLWYENHVAVLGPRVRGYSLRRDGAYDGLTEVTINAAREAGTDRE